jgi:hypothetical protein
MPIYIYIYMYIYIYIYIYIGYKHAPKGCRIGFVRIPRQVSFDTIVGLF